MKKLIVWIAGRCLDVVSKCPIINRIIPFFSRLLISEFKQLPEGRLFLNPEDMFVSGSIYLNTFEPSVIEFVRKNVKEGMKVIDIGANVGIYTLLFSKAVGSNGSVYSFEPDDASYGFLKKTVEYNNLSNVVLYNNAVGLSSAKAFLKKDSINYGNSAICSQSINQSISQKNNSSEFLQTDLVAIDQIKQIDFIDFLKIDIQGYEYSALVGAKSKLIKSNMIIVFELWPEGLKNHGSSCEELLEFLKSLKFQFYLPEYFDQKKVLKHSEIMSKLSLFPHIDLVACRNHV